MCWFHMKKATKAMIASTIKDKEKRILILQDIYALHISPTESLFEAGVELFFVKWRANKTPDIDEFLNYFQDEWIDSHKG